VGRLIREKLETAKASDGNRRFEDLEGVFNGPPDLSSRKWYWRKWTESLRQGFWSPARAGEPLTIAGHPRSFVKSRCLCWPVSRFCRKLGFSDRRVRMPSRWCAGESSA